MPDKDPLGILSKKPVQADPLGILKKKVDGQPLENGSEPSSDSIPTVQLQSKSTLPEEPETQETPKEEAPIEDTNPISLVLKYNKLSKESSQGTPTVSAGTGGAGVSLSVDKNKLSQAQLVKSKLKDLKIDDKKQQQISEEFADFPQGAENIEVKRADGTIDKPYSFEALNKLREENYAAYLNKINAIKNYFDIKNSVGTNKANEYARLQYIEPNVDVYQGIQNFEFQKGKQAEIINQNLKGEAKEKALNRLNQNSELWAAQTIPTALSAKDYLTKKFASEKTNLSVNRPSAENMFVGEMPYQGDDLDNYSLESIQSKLDPNNKVDQYIFNRYKQGVDLKNSLATSPTLDDAAIDYSAKQNATIGGQKNLLEKGGMDLPNGMKGEMVDNFLNNEDVKDLVKSDPELAKMYRHTQQSLYFNYPAYAKKKVATIISQAREDRGMNNWFANVPTQESTDKLVDQLVKEGKLTEQEKLVYEKQIRDELGVLQSVKRGALRIPFGAFVEKSPLETPGFLESTQNSFNETIKGTAKSIEDFSSIISPIARKVLPNESERAYSVLQDDYNNVAMTPKGKLHEISEGTGHLTGFMIPMMVGGSALGGTKAGHFISNALMFEGGNRDRALTLFPDNPTKRYLYTALSTAGDVMLGELIPNKEARQGISNALKSDIAKVASGLADNTITAEAARKTLLEKVTEYVPRLAIENAKTAGTMTGFGVFHNTVDALSGANNMKASDIAYEAVKSFKSTYLTTPLLAALALHGKAGDNKVNGKILMEVATNPDTYIKIIENEAATSEEGMATKEEKLENLKNAVAIKKDLDETNLTEEQKQKYLITALAQKIWEKKATSASDEAIGQQYFDKAKEAKIEKEKILKGEDKADDYKEYTENATMPANVLELPELKEQVDDINRRIQAGGVDGEKAKQELAQIKEDPIKFYEDRKQIARENLTDETSLNKALETYDNIINKIKQYDKENESRLSGGVGVGEKPIEAKPIEGRGTQEIGGGGNIQKEGISREGEGIEGKVGEVEVPKQENALNNIENFKTSKGSVYTVTPEGKTQRFKTATGEQNEPQDLTVFAKLEGQKEQDFLEAIQKSKESGKKVYVVDENGNIIRTNEQAKGKKIYLAIANEQGTKILDWAEASTTPKKGHNVYDQRSFKEGENEMTERHLGNKVIEIKEKQQAELPKQEGVENVGEKVAAPTVKDFTKQIEPTSSTIKTVAGDKAYNYINKDGVEVTLKEDEDGGYVNGNQVQADVHLDFIGNDTKRGEGLASKELDRIITQADKNDMSISLVVDSDQAVRGTTSEKGLSDKELKKWYESKGFIFDKNSRFGYRPKATEDTSIYKKPEYIAKKGEITYDNIGHHSSPEDLQEAFDQDRLKEGTFHEDGTGDIYKVEDGKLKEVKNAKEAGTYEKGIYIGKIEYSELPEQKEAPKEEVKVEAPKEKIKVEAEVVEPKKAELPEQKEIPTGKQKRKASDMAVINRVDAKKVYQEVWKTDEPVDAIGAAQRWLATGGKVNRDSFSEQVTGYTKSRGAAKTSISTDAIRSEFTGAEKDLPTINKAAHDIWESFPEHIQDNVSDQDVRDALIDQLQQYNKRVDLAKDYLKNYSLESAIENYYKDIEERENVAFEKEMKDLNEWMQQTGEEEGALRLDEDYINNLIKQYEEESRNEPRPIETENKGVTEGETTGAAKEVSGIEGARQEEPTEPKPAEVEPPIPPTKEEKITSEEGEPKLSGVSHERLNQLAKRLGLPEIERGTVLTPKEYADRGRRFIEAGVNPIDVANQFKEDKLIDPDRISIARANLEILEKKADDIGKKLGFESKEYKDALSEVDDWARNVTKPMGTKAGETMISLQGGRDMNTDSFTYVKKQVEELTGTATTKEQNKKIEELTNVSKNLQDKINNLETKLRELADKNFEEKQTPAQKKKYVDKALSALDNFQAKIRNKTYSDVTGITALIDMGITTIRAAIKAGVKVSDAIETGISKIKQAYKDKYGKEWEKEDEFRKDITEAFGDETRVEEELPEQKKANQRIKQLEKELEDLKAGKEKVKTEKREPTDREIELKRQIEEEKQNKMLLNLQNNFVDKRDNNFTTEEASQIWQYAKKAYLDKGYDYKQALSRVSDDTGLSWRQVLSAITTPKEVKEVSNEIWKKRSDLLKHQNAVKRWIEDQDKSGVYKGVRKISDAFRGAAVFGHGGIFVGTHAGMNLFDPTRWKSVIPAFLNGYKFAYGDKAKYEIAMEELKNSENYITAQRAGLKNNPDDYNADEYQKYQSAFKKFGMSGQRGFNAIKLLRQQLFDAEYNKLTDAEKADPKAAESIAHLMNLATGATNLKIPEAINEMTFAGGMEAARWGKLFKNPVKASEIALKTILNPEKASVSDRVFARVWAKRVGIQLGTFTAALLANAAIQNYFFPNNKVNISNPQDPDWLKFKFGNVSIDPTSGMLQPVNFLRNIADISTKPQKELGGRTRLGKMGETGIKYVRGKLSPFYGTALEQLTRTDYKGNVLPYFSDNPSAGKHKMTYLEYALSKSPLPIAEAMGEIYNSAAENDGDRATTNHVLDGILSGGLSGATGFKIKVGEDIKEKKADYTKQEVFTEEEIKSPKYKTLTDAGIEIPKVNTRLNYQVKPDVKHPKGIMTQEEYKNFSELVIKYSREYTDKYLGHSDNKSKMNKLKDLMSKNQEDPRIEAEITKIKKELKTELNNAHDDAIKKARIKLKLPIK